MNPPKVNAADAWIPFSESAPFKECGGVKKKHPAIMANPTKVIISPKVFIYLIYYRLQIYKIARLLCNRRKQNVIYHEV